MENTLNIATLVDKARHCNGGLLLPVSDSSGMSRCSLKNEQILHPVVSPYFQRSSLQEIGTGRDTLTILTMLDALIVEILIVSGVPKIAVSFVDSSTHIFDSTQILDLSFADIAANGYESTVESAIHLFATNHSFTVGLISGGVPAGLSAAPLGAVADSPADAITNYNVVTTLLGAVTGAVNAANTKQNAIAVQLNSLLAELRTLGLIHA